VSPGLAAASPARAPAPAPAAALAPAPAAAPTAAPAAAAPASSTSLDAEVETFIQDVKRTSSSHAQQIIHNIIPRFFRLAPKLKGQEGKGFALPDGRSFTSEAALFQAICPSLGRSSFFYY